MGGKTCRLLAAPLVVSVMAATGLFALPTMAVATADTPPVACGGTEADWLGSGVTATYTGPVQGYPAGETGTGSIALDNAAGENSAEVTIDVPGGKQVLRGNWVFTNTFGRGVMRIETEDGREGQLANPTCGPSGTLVTGVDFVCAVADNDDNCQFSSFFDDRTHPWNRD